MKIITKENRALLLELVRTDFKLRYQSSVLGYLWSLLRPLFLFVILYFVFVNFLKIGQDVPHFPVYLLLGIVLWNFFVEMTMQSLGSIVGRGDLIRKIKIPRWIIVFSSSISASINLLLNLLVIVVFLLVNGVSIRASILWFPVDLLQIYVFALGVSFFLAAAFVKFRDISYIWEVLIQAGFYATPILYPVSKITDLNIQKLLFMNPLAVAIQNARFHVVTEKAITAHERFNGGWYAMIPVALTIVVFVGGVSYFRSQSKSFAENI